PGYAVIGRQPGDVDDPRRIFDRVRSAKQLFRPGETFSYQNVNYVLVAEIVRRVTGRTAIQLVEEKITSVLRRGEARPPFAMTRLSEPCKTTYAQLRLEGSSIWQAASCSVIRASIDELLEF